MAQEDCDHSQVHHVHAARPDRKSSGACLLLRYLTPADWWDRIWVVQEVLLAPRSMTILLSGKELAWYDLVKFTIRINSHEPDLSQ